LHLTPAHAQEASEQATPSDQQSPVPAFDNAASDAEDPCLAAIPGPSPTPLPGLHRVIQMVNCTNQTILGAADAAGRSPGEPVGVFPREKTWVMGPVGSKPRPDGSAANVLTIDVPLLWEDTGPIKSTGPILWARTGCRYDTQDEIIVPPGMPGGRAQCETGGSGGLYDISAAKLGPSAGTTITEWTFYQQDDAHPTRFLDHPDISLVNGGNLNVDVEPLGGSSSDQFDPNNQFWLAQQYPLSSHTQDLRNPANCPAPFQVSRSDLTQPNFLKKGIIGMVIQNNDGTPQGGDSTVSCLSNCGRQEYPSVPVGKKDSKGIIQSDLCDPTDKTGHCYLWKVFCTPLGGAYDQLCTGEDNTAGASLCNVTPPVPQVGDPWPIPQYTHGAFHGACWVRGIPSDHTPKPRCSGDSFLRDTTCPANICTHPFATEPGAQPPFGSCEKVVGKGNLDLCIGDDLMHATMPKAYTWPNDPQTYVDDAPGYRIIFGPGTSNNNLPITPSTQGIPLCSSLPSNYNIDVWYNFTTKKGLCSGDVNNNHAVFAIARFNSTANKNQWSCNLNNGSATQMPGSGDDGVVCRWFAPSPTPTATPTSSGSPTPSSTPTATATSSGSPTATATRTATSTPTGAPTPTATPTGAPTATPTTGPTPTPTLAPTATPTATPQPRVNAFLQVRPAPFDFGKVAVGKSKNQGLVLFNRATKKQGTVITISDIFMEGGVPFSQSNNCPTALGPQQTCKVIATFSPTTTGPVSGFLMIIDNSSNGPVRVNLAGTGK